MNASLSWRKCSSCKKDILLNAKYYECSVSTCTGLRTGYVFCSIPCWEVHLPGARHRDAGAIEKKSPSQQTSANPETPATAQRRIIVGGSSSSAAPPKQKSSMSNEVLVVVSKMKQYIRDISDMNTSEEVSQKLSELIREECDKAVEQARADGRKTVMARDFKI